MRCQLGLRVRCCVAIERDFFSKLPIAGPDIAGPRNGAVFDIERVDFHAEPLRRQFEKYLANLGTHMPQCAAGLLHRETA